MAAFDEAANLFVAMVDEVSDSGWDKPGLGSWSVLELVAHGLRALTLVEEYLLRPVEPVADPKAYVAPDAVAARARAAVDALGPSPKRTVHATRARVLDIVRGAAPDAVVGTPFGSVPLVTYLPTRTAELTIHSLDLAVVTGARVDLSDTLVRETLTVLVGIAAAKGRGTEVIRALSGRGTLSAGFNVY
jgi:hypothetical protein